MNQSEHELWALYLGYADCFVAMSSRARAEEKQEQLMPLRTLVTEWPHGRDEHAAELARLKNTRWV